MLDQHTLRAYSQRTSTCIGCLCAQVHEPQLAKGMSQLGGRGGPATAAAPAGPEVMRHSFCLPGLTFSCARVVSSVFGLAGCHDLCRGSELWVNTQLQRAWEEEVPVSDMRIASYLSC